MMFKGTNIDDFKKSFSDEEHCKEYLRQLKLKNGFCCIRCGCGNFGKGHTSFHLRCLNCNYEESPTSNTLFHRLKIPLQKAFGMVFRLVVPSSSTTSLDLADEYSVNPKTAEHFARKLRLIMVSEENEEIESGIFQSKVIDSIIISHREKHLSGLQEVGVFVRKIRSSTRSKKRITIAIVESPKLDSKDCCELLFGKFVKEKKDIGLWNFKTRITGSHHRCSLNHLQGYLNQYFFKSSHRAEKELAWHMIMEKIVLAKPIPIRGFGLK